MARAAAAGKGIEIGGFRCRLEPDTRIDSKPAVAYNRRMAENDRTTKAASLFARMEGLPVLVEFSVGYGAD